MIELDKWFDEKMKMGGEWRQKMERYISEQRSKFWVEYDANDCEWSRKRGIISEGQPISFGRVISLWRTKKFGCDQTRFLAWCKQTKINIELSNFRIDWTPMDDEVTHAESKPTVIRWSDPSASYCVTIRGKVNP
jgi:hypothetical protein